MKQFCKKISKKVLDDEKTYLCLKLKKITTKELKEVREYLNERLDEFRWGDDVQEQ